MARVPRVFLVAVGTTNHCTWRAHNFDRVFEAPGAYEKFRELLGKYKEKHGILIHAFCLMGTHPHVLCTATKGQEAFSNFWKVVNQCFARWYNEGHKRRGQVTMERLKSPRIQDGRYELEVMRYADMNPVRAGLVKSPKDWPWSSYRHYAFGERDPLIDDAPEYLALGRTGPERRKAYQGLFARHFFAMLLVKHPEFVRGLFVGDEVWVERNLGLHGLSPPRKLAP